MAHTRYTFANVLALIVGVVLCCINHFITAMTFGFSDLGVTGLRKFFIVIRGISVILELPAFLAMFRWCTVGRNAQWSLTACCAAFATCGWAFNMFLLPLILLAIFSVISGDISANSTKMNVSNQRQ
jgi:hypothetical protein